MERNHRRTYHRLTVVLGALLLISGIGTHVNSEGLAATQIIHYLPFIPVEIQDGSCWTHSLIIPQENLWRCTVKNHIYDPCIAVNDNIIVCGADPVADEPGFRLNLTEPLPEDEAISTERANVNVWQFALSDGTVCSFATGATFGVGEKRVNYLCSDQSGILGDIQPGKVWTAERVIMEVGDEGPTVKESETVPIRTIWQIADIAALGKEIGLTPAQVSFRYKGLATHVHGMVRPAIPNNPDEPPYLNGMPGHLRFSFDTDSPSLWFSPNERQLYIFPIEKFQTVFQGEYLDELNRHIHTLQTLLSSRPQRIEEKILIFPTIEASQDLRVQVKYLDFSNGDGIRFIAHYGFEVAPFTNENLFYAFQGVTNNKRYYVAFYYPVSASVLPDTYKDTNIADDYEAFAERYETYRRETIETLEQLVSKSYTPILDQLDAMLESLQIGK